MSSYRVQPDQTAWLTIPPSFPWSDFADDLAWAAEVAQDRAAADAPAVIRTAIAESALVVARSTPPLSGVLERFWWLPSIGRVSVVANLSAAQLDEPFRAVPLEEFAQLGVGGMVQNVSAIEDSVFAEAVDCVLLVPVGERTIALKRLIGRSDGMLLYLDVFVDSGVALFEAEADIVALFASIQIQGDPVPS